MNKIQQFYFDNFLEVLEDNVFLAIENNDTDTNVLYLLLKQSNQIKGNDSFMAVYALPANQKTTMVLNIPMTSNFFESVKENNGICNSVIPKLEGAFMKKWNEWQELGVIETLETNFLKMR